MAHDEGRRGREKEAVAEVAGGDEGVGEPGEAAEVREAVEGGGAKAGPGFFDAGGGERGDQVLGKCDELVDRFVGGAFVEADFFFGGAGE